MVDSILSSRRSFLKLLGAAALSVPVAQMDSVVRALAETSLAVPAPARLPPYILHLLLDAAWVPVSNLISTDVLVDTETEFFQRLDGPQVRHVLRQQVFAFGGACPPQGVQHLFDVFADTRPARFALSQSGSYLEFAGVMRQLDWHVDMKHEFIELRGEVDIIGAVEYRLLESA